MDFQNKAFEDKVSTTMQSLDKLKKSLDFANEKNSFADLNSAAKGFNLEGMASALEGISGKFTAMGAIAFTVLQNVVNRAVDAGIQLGKSLSLDQIIGGFQEYETNMNSIQTVLANTKDKGTNLKDVNQALDELNTYSDQTIYNFSEMARNIGTFTAAGVGLDTSVKSIKGIANLAAISGSNSQQASTAMYQLSQAISAGSVKLMDWNSVVNAGMGGAVFQKALFETGKQMGKISGVKMDTTFEQWTKAGNTFRGSLEKGWLTADVLTTTLQGFTGDLTDAQLTAMGYSAEQVKMFQELGQTGKNAATKVKTLTQLFSTAKEAVGSGWGQTFRLIIGDFEEAQWLFTGFSDAIGKMVGDSADARNNILQGWHDLGGRNALIEALNNTFLALGDILGVVKDAFHEVFPPMTATKLFDLTMKLRDFTKGLIPTQETLRKLHNIFVGLFDGIKIGIEVVKGIWGVFKDLFSTVSEKVMPEGGILDFLSKIGQDISHWKEVLVDGGKIQEFFDQFPDKIKKFFDSLSFSPDASLFDNIVSVIQGLGTKLLDFIKGLFDKTDIHMPQGFIDAADKVKERFGFLKDIAQALGDKWDWLKGKSKDIKDALGEVADFLKEKFAALPQALADILAKTDYNQALDTVNTGFFAALVLAFKKFTDGFSSDGSFMKGITDALQGVNGVLGAMQANLKAKTLMQIAEALALLTASIVVLSLIDSGALTKSMSALAIGMGELVTAMALLSKVSSGVSSGVGLGALAIGLLALSGAILVLSAAAKNMSGLDWNELGKGLLATVIMLGAMVATAKLLEGSTKGMIKAGIGMIGIATALNIMALAVKSFAETSWEEMAQGLVGVGVGLGILVVAVQQLPSKHIIGKSLGLIGLATALNILALSVKSFADLDWAAMGKGLAGVASSLLVITLVVKNMPDDLEFRGAGLLMLGIGLVSISKAMQTMSGLSWGEMAKGLVGIGGALLAISAFAPSGAGGIPGAIGVALMAVALTKMFDILKKFSGMKWGDFFKGLGMIAIVLAAVAAAAMLMEPALPLILGLGVALGLVGLAMVAFGAGAFLLATAFSIIATAGSEGVSVLLEALDGFIQRLPEFIAKMGEGFLQLAGEVLKALPALIANIGQIIAALLDVLIQNIPKAAEAFTKLILAGLQVIKDTVPEFVATGLAVLLAFLHGIEANIGEITTTVVNIITGFLDALAKKVPQIIDSVFNLVKAIIQGVIDKLGDIGSWLLDKGVELLGGLWQGIQNKANDVYLWFTQLPGKLLGYLKDAANWLYQKGIDLITGLFTGLVHMGSTVMTWFIELPGKVLGWIGDVASWLYQKGWDFLWGLLVGIVESAADVMNWFIGLGASIVGWIGDAASFLLDAGSQILHGLWQGILNAKKWLLDQIGKIKDWIVDEVTSLFGILSPSRVMAGYGKYIGLGLAVGIGNSEQDVRDAAVSLGDNVLDAYDPSLTKITDSTTKIIQAITNALSGVDAMGPTITPVLDLSNVQNGASQLAGMLSSGAQYTASLSYSQASQLAASAIDTTATETGSTVPAEPAVIKFEQNNYSPEALSSADIYIQTRNQLALAKEELGV